MNLSSVGSQSPEAPQLGLHIAATRMGRCVDEPIGRQDPVLAGTTDPVVAGMVVPHQIHHFDAALARDDIPLCGLFAITAVMMSGCLQVHHNGVGPFDLSCM